MKILFFLAAFIFSSVLLADPDNGPIVPWPTSGDTLKIIPEDLAGTWYGFDDSSEWIITISPVVFRMEYFQVRMESNSLFNKSAQGLFYTAKDGVWGNLDIDNNHSIAAVIIRDRRGYRLRISKSRKHIIEMDINRLHSGFRQ